VRRPADHAIVSRSCGCGSSAAASESEPGAPAGTAARSCRSSSIVYATGSTKNVTRIDEIAPPITAAASGR
jgi:hypothetical protein